MAKPRRFSPSDVAELRRRVLAGETMEALAREHRAAVWTVQAAVRGVRTYAGMVDDPPPVRRRFRMRVTMPPAELARRVPQEGQADGHVFTMPPWWRPVTVEELGVE